MTYEPDDTDLLSEDASIATDRRLIEIGTLYDFVSMAWEHVEPSAFVGNWHIEELCNHLEAVSRCEILRLVINIPPGTSKSSVVGVFWPVWEWIRNPVTRFMFASFDQSLVCRDADKMIKLLTSPWFIARWGVLLERGNLASSDFSNVAGGWRFSTSPGGKATGRHAHIQVADDPIKPKDAAGGSTMRKTALRAVSEWWSSTMATRAADLATLRRIVLMQRLDVDDLAGECIAEGYELLRLPMRYEADNPCVTDWGGDQRTTEGELLFPERFPETAVTTLERELGPDVAAAQLQQRPNRKGGSVFRFGWRYWSHDGRDGSIVLPGAGLQMQSWDCTFKDAATSDFVCGQVWMASARRYFLLDQLCERWDLPATIAAIEALSKKWPKAFDKLIEDKANGSAVEQTLRHTLRGLTLCEPLGGKEARANAVAPLFAAELVYIPHPSIAPWVVAYRTQLENFPFAVNDDMVDSTSQALLRLDKYGDSFSAAMRALRESK